MKEKLINAYNEFSTSFHNLHVLIQELKNEIIIIEGKKYKVAGITVSKFDGKFLISLRRYIGPMYWESSVYLVNFIENIYNGTYQIVSKEAPPEVEHEQTMPIL